MSGVGAESRREPLQLVRRLPSTCHLRSVIALVELEEATRWRLALALCDTAAHLTPSSSLVVLRRALGRSRPPVGRDSARHSRFPHPSAPVVREHSPHHSDACHLSASFRPNHPRILSPHFAPSFLRGAGGAGRARSSIVAALSPLRQRASSFHQRAGAPLATYETPPPAPSRRCFIHEEEADADAIPRGELDSDSYWSGAVRGE
ncbi:hypothetical protein B0H14DRAFT_3788178 [Mycena olivaceomarginata]|nr:hypothetical protein B0H14DRAFT_3788178 [Mycena olivaceomarginata]